MRHAFTVAAGLFLCSQSFVAAQETQNAENLKSLQAARAEIEGLKKDLQAMQSGCKSEAATCCPAVASNRYQMVVRRYAWVPASSVGLNTQVVTSGIAASGVNLVSAPAVVTDNVVTSGYVAGSYVPSGLATSGYVTGLSTGYGYGYGTGFVGARSFSPASANVLPASPNVAHSSYGAYSDGTFSHSLGATGYGTGVLGTGFANTPVYPTAVFRGRFGYINPVPAPHYSVY